ncbi:MAG: hypothetical protein R3Y62_02655 [Eubacteriales bacterium]
MQRAYRQLEAEGLTYSILGKGSFVASKTDQMAPYRQVQQEIIRQAMKELRTLGLSQSEMESILRTLVKEEFEK